MIGRHATPAVHCHAEVGEGPVYDTVTDTLYWVDIPAGHLWRWSRADRSMDYLSVGEPLGSVALIEGGGFLLATRRGVVVLPSWTDLPRLWQPVEPDLATQFNDGKCDHRGRFVAGTAAHDPRFTGALYRVDHDGTTEQLFNGVGMPGETAETMHDCVDGLLALDATVVGFTLGIRAFPYSPLGRDLAARSGGTRAVPGVQSNTATAPILLSRLDQCHSRVEYERQFMFDPMGGFRPVYYFSPALPEGGTARPGDRWLTSLELLWEWVPPHDRPRVMLPTAPGLSPEDNNYADNPFLLRLTELGYTGAYWSHWPLRAEIMGGTVPA
ncbi:SMP-30/gluconolactonase/LRE family protein [Jiangella rhizosphaerae]|uniref:SMP-30/Gluconolactonase/LRE-like region domain-containing protein n=1 Tax=Jiangella rhizosphaerae TaxID=2293569 RepID=A0A418KQK2_9ACTN|nr:SMP-30/gluconolactonase/LRE family protein [Jiangella rhizosphaerae]RIQ22846.1 hypothetical protein DY240_13405 [Jiangella rhizosphaerae]